MRNQGVAEGRDRAHTSHADMLLPNIYLSNLTMGFSSPCRPPVTHFVSFGVHAALKPRVTFRTLEDKHTNPSELLNQHFLQCACVIAQTVWWHVFIGCLIRLFDSVRDMQNKAESETMQRERWTTDSLGPYNNSFHTRVPSIYSSIQQASLSLFVSVSLPLSRSPPSLPPSHRREILIPVTTSQPQQDR